jgi:hypothetical protein
MIQAPDGTIVSLDLGIISAVKALWGAGVATASSCEGADNSMRDVFVWPDKAQLAADVLTELGETVLEIFPHWDLSVIYMKDRETTDRYQDDYDLLTATNWTGHRSDLKTRPDIADWLGWDVSNARDKG